MKPLHSLYGKLALTLTASLFLVGVLYALMSQSLHERSYVSGNQQLNRSLASDLVKSMGFVKNGSIDRETLHDAFHTIMLVNPNVEIYFLDMRGNIIDYSADPHKMERDSVQLAPIESFLTGDSMYPLVGDDPRNRELQKPFSVSMIPDEQNPEGYLYVVLQGSKFDQFQTREQLVTMQNLGLASLTISLMAGLIFGLILFYRLTHRIRKLGKAIDAFRDSNFTTAARSFADIDIGKPSQDEISQLAKSFESMAEHICQQYRDLHDQDKLRRDMVVNVSHDLRTPMAAIHGYLERLHEKIADLPIEESQQYLDILLRNSARLNQLIENLFELSKLEAKEITPRLEPFLLSELVQDVMQKFRLQAQSRKIELAFDNEASSSLVSGDIGLLDRALSNLIDNAIEYTEQGGRVTLVVKHSGDKVSVQVMDTGKGISKEHLAAIFQRFYRADQPHRGDGKHAGLGLAIAQRIIELHGQIIQVKSQLNQGTTFQFAIPVAHSTVA
ncbi:MAG: HAMP domain-containing sensor histidine kinase [Pseudomonadota bacterium]